MGQSPGRVLNLALIGAALGMTNGVEHATAQEDSWQVSVGAGALSRPKFPGSDDHRTEALPIISATHGRFFVGTVPGSGSPAGMGVNLYQDSQWRAGVAMSGDVIKPRKESDDDRLRGLGDIDRTARAAVFAAYIIDWFTVRANVASDIGNKKQGTLAGLDIEGRYNPTDRLTLSAGPGLTWANSQYMQTFFGIDADQSMRSGLPEFEAKSGVSTVHFSAGADYRFAPHWTLAARGSAARLQADAADSPITEDKSQNTYALFAIYRF